MVETCPHCGAILQSEAIKLFPLNIVRQRIFEYLTKYPERTLRQIEAYVYSDDPNGGPLTSVPVILHRMRQTLREHGLDIKSRPGPAATYKLVRIKQKGTSDGTV